MKTSGFFDRFSVDEKPKRIKSRRFQRIMRQWEAAIVSLSKKIERKLLGRYILRRECVMIFNCC